MSYFAAVEAAGTFGFNRNIVPRMTTKARL
jgi:hypothetical protein